MRSNEHMLHAVRGGRLHAALTVAVLAVALAAAPGCREQAAATTTDAAKAPAHAKSEAASEAAAPAARVEPPPPAASEPPQQAASALIGRTMPPYPDGMIEVQGVCVPGGEELERVCDFGIAVLGRENGEQTPDSLYLVASRNADPEAPQPQWNVTDAVEAPAAKEGYELQLGACRIDGEMRNDIVAMVRHGDEEYSADIVWKKSYDTKSGKFADIAGGRVDCIHPGYGL